MLKKIIIFGIIWVFKFDLEAQLIDLKPDNLQLPQVSVLPGCAAADYGKMVFLTTTNKAQVCNGTGWVALETASGGGGGGSLTLPYSANGSFSTQGFQIINIGGGANSAAIQGTTLSTTNDAAGIWGAANTTSPTGETIAVRGSNLSTNNNGIGIKGTHAGGGYGIMGYSTTGTGIYGITSGISSTSYGVMGETNQTSGAGVHGKVSASGASGVYGLATNISANGGFFQNNAGGVALNTFGKLRFQGNGAAAKKVLTSIDATGNAEWQSLTRNEIIKLGPAAFQPHISQNQYTMDGRGIQFTSFPAGVTAGSFHANVQLPNGAVITSYKIHYFDADVSIGLSSYAFQKLDHSLSGVTYANIHNSTFINNNSLSFLEVSNPLNETVNNSTSFYRIVVVMPLSANINLVGAEINYTYAANN